METSKIYNWCPACWFGAKIETWETPIGERWVCCSCAATGRFNDGSDPYSLPRFFTAEEWDEYWSANIKDTLS